mmetsp:Transcript_21373/g.50613  ORF Transcript_21373/g.50613 Transcript_21373/m.50613 type:complete len:278 (-) Transcript_21373:318-1151(-)
MVRHHRPPEFLEDRDPEPSPPELPEPGMVAEAVRGRGMSQNPWVRAEFRRRQAALRARVQEPLHQLHRGRTESLRAVVKDVPPEVLRGSGALAGAGAGLIQGKQALGNGPGYGRVRRLVGPIEGVGPGQHRVDDDPRGKHVPLGGGMRDGSASVFGRGEALGRRVGDRPVVGQPNVGLVVVRNRPPEIDNLEAGLLGPHEEVFGLEVRVDVSLGVDVAEAVGELAEEPCRVALREGSLLAELLEEFPAPYEFHGQVAVGVVPHRWVVQSAHVGMPRM